MKKHKKPLDRSEIMSRIKSSNTKIEILLRKALWHKGVRYRKNDRSVYGTPDIVLKSLKIAIFCDSEFWHGKDFSEDSFKIKTNRDFWIHKINKNIDRDQKTNEYLLNNNWIVLRFWGKEILENLDEVVNLVLTTIKKKKADE